MAPVDSSTRSPILPSDSVPTHRASQEPSGADTSARVDMPALPVHGDEAVTVPLPQAPDAHTAHAPQTPGHALAPTPAKRAAMAPDNGGAWTWAGVFASVSAAVGKLNPTGVALRQVLAPGAYGYLPTDIHPGKDADVRRLDTVLGGHVDMRAYPPLEPDAAHVAIVGFHGNGCTADSMDPMWQALRNQGHVFAVNLPGYGGSSVPADGSELELHMAASVQAVRDHLLHELGFLPKHLIWYGLSLGGSQAAIGFEMTPGSHVAVQNTFTCVTDVTGNVLQKALGRASGLLAALASSSGMPRGLRRRDLQYRTDGLDTVGKFEKIAEAGEHQGLGSRLLVLGAEADALMPNAYPRAIAHAFYGDSIPDDCLHVSPGATHNSPLDLESMQLLRTFLRRAGQ